MLCLGALAAAPWASPLNTEARGSVSPRPCAGLSPAGCWSWGGLGRHPVRSLSDAPWGPSQGEEAGEGTETLLSPPGLSSITASLLGRREGVP